MLAALASPLATEALDPDLYSRHSLRHVVYAILLQFGVEEVSPNFGDGRDQAAPWRQNPKWGGQVSRRLNLAC